MVQGTSAENGIIGTDMDQLPVYSRKKSRTAGIRKDDTLAWRRVEGRDPELVFRSPVDPPKWVNREDLDRIIADLVSKEVRFASRKGHMAILNPKHGQIGWLKQPEKPGRRRQMFMFDSWMNNKPQGIIDMI